MADPDNHHVRKIQLFHSIDGGVIEQYIIRRRLRSGDDTVSSPDRSGSFEAGTNYGFIVVESTSAESATKTANDLASKFDGIVF